MEWPRPSGSTGDFNGAGVRKVLILTRHSDACARPVKSAGAFCTGISVLSARALKTNPPSPSTFSVQVIVTEWIEGERLGDAKTEDVKALCSTLLNCYLIQVRRYLLRGLVGRGRAAEAARGIGQE